jgi:hypothetical protein
MNQHGLFIAAIDHDAGELARDVLDHTDIQ